MKANTEIIVEVGYNHLGSPYMVDNILELTAKNNLSITFQIRSINFENKDILDINLNYLLDRIKLYKNNFSNNFKIHSDEVNKWINQNSNKFLKKRYSLNKLYLLNTKLKIKKFLSLGP